MNWEALGAVAELFGALAVFASLVYLARQIRQQNLIARDTTWRQIFEGFNDMNAMAGSDPNVGELFFRGLHDPDSLSKSEKARHLILMNMQLNQTMKAHHSYQSGLISEDEWVAMAIHFGEHLSTEGGKRYRAQLEQRPLGQQAPWANMLSDLTKVLTVTKGARDDA